MRLALVTISRIKLRIIQRTRGLRAIAKRDPKTPCSSPSELVTRQAAIACFLSYPKSLEFPSSYRVMSSFLKRQSVLHPFHFPTSTCTHCDRDRSPLLRVRRSPYRRRPRNASNHRTTISTVPLDKCFETAVHKARRVQV
jgi:hypothetical protein